MIHSNTDQEPNPEKEYFYQQSTLIRIAGQQLQLDAYPGWSFGPNSAFRISP